MPRKSLPLPDVALLREMFALTKDGRLVNKISRTARHAGDFADESLRRGYRTIFCEGRLYFAHRIVWVIVNGKDPDGFIDHINGNPLDNRPENLRESSHSQNMFNSRLRSDSSSGVKGVHHRKDNNMWRAYITVRGKRKNIGQFRTKADAELALIAPRNEMHGEFARSA